MWTETFCCTWGASWQCLENFTRPFIWQRPSSKCVQLPVLDGLILLQIMILLNAPLNCNTFGLLLHPNCCQIFLKRNSVESWENLCQDILECPLFAGVRSFIQRAITKSSVTVKPQIAVFHLLGHKSWPCSSFRLKMLSLIELHWLINAGNYSFGNWCFGPFCQGFFAVQCIKCHINIPNKGTCGFTFMKLW